MLRPASFAVVMSLDGASTAEQINITKGGLNDIYRGLQFHFHWGDRHRNGSEHTLDGHHYDIRNMKCSARHDGMLRALPRKDAAVEPQFLEVPSSTKNDLERFFSSYSLPPALVQKRFLFFFSQLHLVHMNTKYKTLGEAKGHPNGIAVLSFLFKVSEADNTNYNTIVAGLKNISRAEDYVDLASTFSLSNLLPRMDLLSKYYRYKGSLTTPGCEEVVTWTIFEEQIPISKTQLDAFVDTIFYKPVGTSLLKMTNNIRPLQPLNSRKVYASRDATVSRGHLLAANLLLPLLLALLAGHFSGPS
ncbi:hypothetical protein lerEdw1_003648 [Lerista edwardsae]|nr:hypothetical protein lerEdw1_003648 [Lerista edwardsae]